MKVRLVSVLFLFLVFIRPFREECLEIPIVSYSSGRPMVNIVIEGGVYLGLLDLGSSFPFTLPEGVLDKIKRTPHRMEGFCDYRGRKYVSARYYVPKIVLGPFVWRNVSVEEEHAQFRLNTTWNLKGEVFEERAVVGFPILEKSNLLLDFSKNRVYACNNLKVLQKRKLIGKDLVKVPFDSSRKRIVIEGETDSGKKMFVLDTGSTISTISSVYEEGRIAGDLPIVSSSRFILGGYDFGPIELSPIHAKELKEGLLGMNFLSRYIFYIDNKNGCLYVELP